jgi:Holliday junction resolvase RusA-like endonuclease
MRIIIKGQVPSKSNGYKIGGNRLYKSKELKAYEESFAWQVTRPDKSIEGKFGVELVVYFQSNRSDLDNAAKIILDCLQANGIVKNDRNCYILTMIKNIDKENPRVLIYIYEID